MAISAAYWGGVTTSRLGGPVQNTVYARRLWSSSWEWLPYVYATRVTETAAPEVGSAEIAWEFGYVKQHYDAATVATLPLTLAGSYVQIRVHDQYGTANLWTGYCQHESTRPLGSTDIDGGAQRLHAHGLEALLDRARIQASYTDGGWIDTPLVFNGKRGGGWENARGNRSTSVNGDGVYAFSNDAELWTDRQIADYLLAYYGSGWGPTYYLAGATPALDSSVRRRDLTGLTCRQALNTLIDPRRGLGWTIFLDAADNVVVYVFSNSDRALYFEDSVLSANADQVWLDFDGRHDLNPEFTWNQLQSYPEIHVRGGPVRTCASFSVADGTLEAGWSATQETTYKTAGGSGASSADNDQVRRREGLRAVYQRLRVPDAWDWQVNNGEGTGTDTTAAPEVNYDGTVTTATAATAQRIDKAFDRFVPLLEEVDSTGTPVYRRPFAVVKNSDGDWLEAHGGVYLGLEIEDEELGVYVTASVPHLLARNHFDTGDAGTYDSELDPEYDYEDTIITAQVPTDRRLEARVAVPGVWASEVSEPLVIDVPDAEYWWIAPGTVTGIDSSLTLTRQATALEVRNDASRLRHALVLAMAYYGRPRAQASIRIPSASLLLPAGTMLTGAVSGRHWVDVGTVVTKRVWEFRGSSPQTTITTGWRGIDVA